MIGQIFEKLAKGQQLSAQERNDLVNWANRVNSAESFVSGTMTPGSENTTLESPIIRHPFWETSPLRVLHMYLSTDTSIPNNTWTPITFDFATGDTSIFNFKPGSLQKIVLHRLNICINGIVDWAVSTAFDRAVRIKIYDVNDVSLGTKELINGPASNSGGFGLKQNFHYIEDIKEFFPEVDYMVLEVFQNSGGALNIENIAASVSMA